MSLGYGLAGRCGGASIAGMNQHRAQPLACEHKCALPSGALDCMSLLYAVLSAQSSLLTLEALDTKQSHCVALEQRMCQLLVKDQYTMMSSIAAWLHARNKHKQL